MHAAWGYQSITGHNALIFTPRSSLASPVQHLPFFGRLEVTGEPRRNPHVHEEDLQKSVETITQAQDRTREHGAVRWPGYTLHQYAAHLITEFHSDWIRNDLHFHQITVPKQESKAAGDVSLF